MELFPFLIGFRFQQNRDVIISISNFSNGSSVSILYQSVSILEMEQSVYFSIGLETGMPFLFSKFRNGNRVSIPLLF